MIEASFAQRVRDVLATLTPREEQVLRMRYGFGEVPDEDACARLMRDLFPDVTGNRIDPVRVPCPFCGAKAGEPCLVHWTSSRVGRDGTGRWQDQRSRVRETFHRARIKSAVA